MSVLTDRSPDARSVDWVVLLLPTVISIRVFSPLVSLLGCCLLAAVAFLRPASGRFSLRPAPMALLLLSSAIVFSRPADLSTLLTFVVVTTLTVWVVINVDARCIIDSLTDGCGLYLVVNVAAFAAGLQSPSSDIRVGGLVEESTGFVRTVFPMTWSINAPPVVAAVYGAAIVFTVRQSGGWRLVFRITALGAAGFVLLAAGSRVALALAVMLPAVIAASPLAARVTAQISTVLATISAFVWKSVAGSIAIVITPLMALAGSRRIEEPQSISTLNGRDYIWGRSIQYWNEQVHGLPQILFGFGAHGQNRSGASITYREWISSIVRNPELAFVHNSFLQQLFDGGIVGLLALAAALFWTSSRLAEHLRTWDRSAASAVAAMSVLLLTAMTEAYLAPGVGLESFWLLIVLVGVSCQGPRLRHTASAASESMKGAASGSGNRGSPPR